MIVFLIAYLFDCIGAIIAAQSITSLLLLCFISVQVTDSEFDYSPQKFYFPLTLLLVQDFMQSGRFGFALIWLIPLIGGIWLLKRMVLCSSMITPFLVTALGMLGAATASSLILTHQLPLLLVTFSKIWYTWICGIVLNLGLRGNRCWRT